MPRTKDSITWLYPDFVHFGDKIPVGQAISYISGREELLQARLVVTKPDETQLYEIQFVRLNGVDSFVFGPTPVWPGGEAKGQVFLTWFNTHKGIPVDCAESETFDILA